MSAESDYSLLGYDSSTLFIRGKRLPLVIYLGKNEYSYFLSMPPISDPETYQQFYRWFHNDLVDIVDFIVKKRRIHLDEGQRCPSKAGGKVGWYLPLGVLLEIQKMWAEDKVPIVFDILRPADLIYGRGWTKRDIINVLEDYLYGDKTTDEATSEQELKSEVGK